MGRTSGLNVRSHCCRLSLYARKGAGGGGGGGGGGGKVGERGEVGAKKLLVDPPGDIRFDPDGRTYYEISR